MSDASRTANHWDNDPTNTGRVDFWWDLPGVQRRQAIKESGRADGDWIDHTLRTHLAGRLPLARCLSLGCGRGRVERQWAERKAFLACDAYDISPASIADAAQAAQQAGFSQIHYAVADIDHMELPAQHYDAVWAVSSAHHFSQLEHVFAQVAQTLKPGGLFILHEYVGANRFQFGARQRQIIEACLSLLPLQYRLLPPPPPPRNWPMARQRRAFPIVAIPDGSHAAPWTSCARERSSPPPAAIGADARPSALASGLSRRRRCPPNAP
jgi:SAM-dependent methyltransferase